MSQERIEELLDELVRELDQRAAQGIACLGGNPAWQQRWDQLMRELREPRPLEWPSDEELLTWPKSCMQPRQPADQNGSTA